MFYDFRFIPMQELPNSRFANYPQSTKSMILYSLGNVLGSYHKTKFTNTYEKYAHKFDTNLSPYGFV